MKVYVIQVGNHIRSMFAADPIKVGQFIPDEIWLGQIVKGGFVKKVF